MATRRRRAGGKERERGGGEGRQRTMATRQGPLITELQSATCLYPLECPLFSSRCLLAAKFCAAGRAAYARPTLHSCGRRPRADLALEQSSREDACCPSLLWSPTPFVPGNMTRSPTYSADSSQCGLWLSPEAALNIDRGHSAETCPPAPDGLHCQGPRSSARAQRKW